LAQQGQLAHSDLTPVLRCHGSGGAGENVGEHGSISAMHQLWLGSSGHAANILNPGYTRIGIGVSQDGRGRYFAVVEFAT
jgi:uncharacterized protein YkwD